MIRSHLRSAALLATAAQLVLLAGCGGSPAKITGMPGQAKPAPGVENLPLPGGDPGPARTPIGVAQLGSQFPLEPGRTWKYGVRYTLEMIEGSQEIASSSDYWRRTRTLTCTQSQNGHDYIVDRWSDEASGETDRWWLLLRQDRSGLYEADAVLSSAPSCETGAPSTPGLVSSAALDRTWRTLAANPRVNANRKAWEGAWGRQKETLARIFEGLGRTPQGLLARRQLPGPGEGELLRLAYPLRPGQAWVIRRSPLFESQVEAVETIAVPAGRYTAFRVRNTSEIYPDGDVVRTWYGRDGFLRLQARLKFHATDDSGNVIGEMIATIDETLRSATTAPAN